MIKLNKGWNNTFLTKQNFVKPLGRISVVNWQEIPFQRSKLELIPQIKKKTGKNGNIKCRGPLKQPIKPSKTLLIVNICYLSITVGFTKSTKF
jgi:hypothetical protein